MLREVYPNLWVGNYGDAVENPGRFDYVLHAAKEPHHRDYVGYVERGAPKDHPEYLFARRGNKLALNFIDVPNPAFIQRPMIDAAIAFMDEATSQGTLLVHCNQGESRAPGLALYYLAGPGGPFHGEDFDTALQTWSTEHYPETGLGKGVEAWIRSGWAERAGL